MSCERNIIKRLFESFNIDGYHWYRSNASSCETGFRKYPIGKSNKYAIDVKEHEFIDAENRYYEKISDKDKKPELSLEDYEAMANEMLWKSKVGNIRSTTVKKLQHSLDNDDSSITCYALANTKNFKMDKNKNIRIYLDKETAVQANEYGSEGYYVTKVVVSKNDGIRLAK